LPIKAWGEGHEMAIKKRGRKRKKRRSVEIKREKGNKNKWKMLARLSRGKI
jgi:hypothetical protein